MTHRSLTLLAAVLLLTGCVATPRTTNTAPRPATPRVATATPPHSSTHGTTPHNSASHNPSSHDAAPSNTGANNTNAGVVETQAVALPAGQSGSGAGMQPGGSGGASRTGVATSGTLGEMPLPPPRELLAAMGDAQPRVETRTRRGNPPVYTVLGQTYQLLRSAAGYRERGVASWYGPDFHAKNTANGEAYDMYAMTAAHRTLPIPVYLKVTNLANGKSVTVRVNDRGPFKHNRIVDLSYTAAMKLGMLNQGTAFVEVEAILPPGDDGLLPEMTSAMAASAPRAPSVLRLAAQPTGGLLYAQVGAFGIEANALALRERLQEGGVKNVLVVRGPRNGKALWRVRIGPIASVDDYDAVVDQLERLGIRGISLARSA